MNKFIKYGWWVLIIASLVFAFGVYKSNSYKEDGLICSYECKEALKKAEEYGSRNVSRGEKEMFKFQENLNCPDDYVDWDIATTALSEYVRDFIKQNPGLDYDFGPAEIERHFAENCEEDLKIYNEYMARNPNKETPKYSQQEMKEVIIYYNKSEEFNKALLLAKEYVALYPDDLEGWVHRGYAYMNLGNCVEASADFYHGSVNGNEDASMLLAYVANSGLCKID